MIILMAHDGSASSDRALERAIQVAEKFGAELVLVSVTADLCLPVTELSAEQCREMAEAFEAEAGKRMEAATARAASRNIASRVVIRSGDAVDTILETAESAGADLIVLGSRGRSRATRFLLGSVSSRVAEHAKCDVLIVK